MEAKTNYNNMTRGQLWELFCGNETPALGKAKLRCWGVTEWAQHVRNMAAQDNETIDNDTVKMIATALWQYDFKGA